MSTTRIKRRLVIVGGGYLGSDLAKSLDGEMDVTLIERATHFTHAPAMIRAMVDPTLLDEAPILVPLGPRLGSSFLMAFTGGDWIIRMMKGKDLFLSKYRKLLDQT